MDFEGSMKSIKYMKAKLVIIITIIAAVLFGDSVQAGGKSNQPPFKKAKPVKPVKPPKPPKPLIPTKYSGRAVGLSLSNTVTGAALVLGDTGPLRRCGGSIDLTLGGTNVDVLSVGGIHVSAVGVANVSTSTAEVTNLVLTLIQDGVTNEIAIAAAIAQARAECGSNGLTLTASSQVQGLTINGVPAVITGATNEIVAVPGGSIVLNAQLTSTNCSKAGEITVAAAFLMLTNGLQGSIGYVEADITCGSQVPPGMRSCDKVTGGGFIVTTGVSTNVVSTNGVCATYSSFGLMAGNKHGQRVGKLNYIDHGTGMHVTSTAVTGFTVVDAVSRAIDFDVLIDGVAGTARVLVADNGEPGRNDIFDITLSTGYHAGGDLGGAGPGGGNIQLHKCPPGWAK